MGRKNRRNRQQQQRPHGSPHITAASTQPRSQQHQQRPAAPVDADIAHSIAALGERIDQLKARWADTQTRIETLRQASRDVLAEHSVAASQITADADETAA